jgi:hypothetical protein
MRLSICSCTPPPLSHDYQLPRGQARSVRRRENEAIKRLNRGVALRVISVCLEKVQREPKSHSGTSSTKSKIWAVVYRDGKLVTASAEDAVTSVVMVMCDPVESMLGIVSGLLSVLSQSCSGLASEAKSCVGEGGKRS